MLVDGGYCNNVPSDVMCRLFHPNTVILLVKSDVVVRPPLRDVYLADNSRYDEIENRGYNEGKQRLMEWLRLVPKDSWALREAAKE